MLENFNNEVNQENENVANQNDSIALSHYEKLIYSGNSPICGIDLNSVENNQEKENIVYYKLSPTVQLLTTQDL